MNTDNLIIGIIGVAVGTAMIWWVFHECEAGALPEGVPEEIVSIMEQGSKLTCIASTWYYLVLQLVGSAFVLTGGGMALRALAD